MEPVEPSKAMHFMDRRQKEKIIEHRSDKKEGIDTIENTAMTGQTATGVLGPRATFDD